ncbi:hypothetical protein LRE75_23450 [Streptomyces sp. 372A]
MFDRVVRQNGTRVHDSQRGSQLVPARGGEAVTGEPCQPLVAGRVQTEKRQTAFLPAGKPCCQEDGALRTPEATAGIERDDRLTNGVVSGIDRQPQH